MKRKLHILNATQRLSIAAGGGFYNVQPENAAWFILKVEDKNFCLAFFVKPKLLLIAICSRLHPTSRPTCSNTFVACCGLSCDISNLAFHN